MKYCLIPIKESKSKIHATLFVRFCDLAASQALNLCTSMRNPLTYVDILEIHKIFVPLSSSTIGGVMFKTFKISILYVQFSLVCRDL